MAGQGHPQVIRVCEVRCLLLVSQVCRVFTTRYLNGANDELYDCAKDLHQRAHLQLGACGIQVRMGRWMQRRRRFFVSGRQRRDIGLCVPAMQEVSYFHYHHENVDFVFVDHPCYHRPGQWVWGLGACACHLQQTPLTSCQDPLSPAEDLPAVHKAFDPSHPAGVGAQAGLFFFAQGIHTGTATECSETTSSGTLF
jgi:hypothetical protein